MRKKITFFTSLVAVIVAALLATVPLVPVQPATAQDAYAYTLNKVIGSYPVGHLNASTTAGSVAMIVKYVGTAQASGRVTVAAGGDLTFEVGASGSETGDTTVECPLSAPYAGVFTVANASCDTLGEVVDLLNASHNWRAVLIDGMRGDSSNNTIATIGATAATGADGLALYFDVPVALFDSKAILPNEYRNSIKPYLTGVNGTQLVANPYKGLRPALFRDVVTWTGTGTPLQYVYSVAVTNKAGVSVTAPAGSTEVVSTYFGAGLAASGTEKIFDYSPYGIWGRSGEKMISRTGPATTMTAINHGSYGIVVKQ